MDHQVVLILVGLIGSGKSTFAQALEAHLPYFRRCNQDDLGDRRAVENLARKSLHDGLSVCIDRTNFDAVQRAHWIRIARERPGVVVWVIVFDTPFDVCADRLRSRRNHPTILSPEQGLEALSRFSSSFRRPTPQEGYDCLISLRPSDHPSLIWTRDDIDSLLRRVRNSPAMRLDNYWPPPARGTQHRGTGPRRSFSRRSHDHAPGFAGRCPHRDGVPDFAGGPRGAFGGVRNRSARDRGASSSRQRPPSVPWEGSGSAQDPFTIL